MKKQLQQLVLSVLTTWQQQGKLPADVALNAQIERTRDEKFGDFSCNIAMLLAKACQRKPLDIANELVAQLPKSAAISEVSVAAPGFINFKMADSEFQRLVTDILQSGEQYGRSDVGAGRRVHVEVVSANPNGPLHVGHGRYAAYGGSLVNLLRAAGYQVHSEYYVNDAGRQMRILAVSVWVRYLQLHDANIPFLRRGYQGDYLIPIARELQQHHGERFWRAPAEVFADLPVDNEENQETYADQLIERAEQLLGKEGFAIIFDLGLNIILQDIKNDLEEFGVVCNEWFHESKLVNGGEVAHGIEQLRAGGYLYEQDGATWFRSSDFGDEKDRVVVRENGQPTYFASDVAYHLNKFERGFDKLLDIYGSDHHGYVPRLRALVQALGRDVNKLEVLLVQFAILYRGKERVSMSTRGGDFVSLRELRSEVGNDAARFFYIMRKREQHLDFDLELAKSQSSDNPVYYIQYAHARICSVFRQLTQKNWQWQPVIDAASLALLTVSHEKALLRCLSRYPEIIVAAAQAYEPSTVAYYLQELANAFHTYYNAQTFLIEGAALRNARLCLIAATRQVLHNGLELLGLSSPEQM